MTHVAMNDDIIFHRLWNHGGSEGTCPHTLAAMGAVPPF